MERSETAIMLHEAQVVLCGEPRVFRVRTIRETAAFRRAIGEILGGVVLDIMENAGDRRNMIQSILPVVMAEGIDKLIDLPFLYAPELAEWREGASDAELIDAGMGVLELAFPLVLGAVKAVLQIAARAQSAGIRAA